MPINKGKQEILGSEKVKILFHFGYIHDLHKMWELLLIGNN
jgi:hypothetical protein